MLSNTHLIAIQDEVLFEAEEDASNYGVAIIDDGVSRLLTSVSGYRLGLKSCRFRSHIHKRLLCQDVEYSSDSGITSE